MAQQFIQVVLFGDSLTWSAQVPFGQRYADYLEEELQTRFGAAYLVDIAACGAGGNTAEEALPRIERDCLAYRPHAVVVNLGANDAGRAPSREIFMRSYRRIVETVIKNAGALLVLETLPTLDEQRHAYRNSPQAFMHGGLEKYLEYFSHSYIRQIAGMHKLPLHDRFAIFHKEKTAAPGVNDRYILPDGVHLTAEGNRFFAHTLADILYTALSKSEPRRSGDAAKWLASARMNVVFMDACVALEKGTLKELLTNQSMPVRLMLQQCRSFARRAFAYAEDKAAEDAACIVEKLAAGLLAAQRAFSPVDDEIRRGSAQWGIEQLRKIATHPPAGKLREFLSVIARSCNDEAI